MSLYCSYSSSFYTNMNQPQFLGLGQPLCMSQPGQDKSGDFPVKTQSGGNFSNLSSRQFSGIFICCILLIIYMLLKKIAKLPSLIVFTGKSPVWLQHVWFSRRESMLCTCDNQRNVPRNQYTIYDNEHHVPRSHCKMYLFGKGRQWGIGQIWTN